jgi:hypothetical protein
MYHLFYLLSRKKNIHLIAASFIAFLFLNVIENFIHYNIGINRNNTEPVLTNPSATDWIRIIIIMVIFAFLQGFLTFLLDSYG